jgi:hypothetical protein
MPCPFCGDRHGKYKRCDPVSLARHGQNQQPRTSSTGQVQQDARNDSMGQMPDLATLRLGEGQLAPPSESTEQQTVHRTAVQKREGRNDPRVGLAREQLIHPTGAVHGEGAPPAPEIDAAGQQAVCSWPRRSNIGHQAVWSPALRKSGVQQPFRIVECSQQSHCTTGSSRSVWNQRQNDRSAEGGQIPCLSGESQHRLARTSGAQPQPGGQVSNSGPGVANNPIPGIESITKIPLSELPSTDRVVESHMMQFRIEARLMIAPMTEAQFTAGLWNSRAALERFVFHLSVAHNSQVSSQRAQMGGDLQLLSPEMCPKNTWSLIMVGRVAPTIFTPRESPPVR